MHFWKLKALFYSKKMDGIIDSMDMSLRKFREIVKDGEPGKLQSMDSQRVGHNLATKQQQ